MRSLAARIVLVVLIAVAGVYLAGDALARRLLQSRVEEMTGFRAEIGSAELALLRGELILRDVRIHNPEGYDEPLFVQMPELFIAYSLPSAFTGTHHVRTLRLVIDRIAVVRNRAGESNVARLQARLIEPEPATGTAPGSRDADHVTRYRLDVLQLHVGEIVVRDDARAAAQTTLHLELDREYRDVSDRTDVARLVLLAVASKVRFADLGLDSAALRERLGRFTDDTGLSEKAQSLARKGQDLLERLRRARDAR